MMYTAPFKDWVLVLVNKKEDTWAVYRLAPNGMPSPLLARCTSKEAAWAAARLLV